MKKDSKENKVYEIIKNKETIVGDWMPGKDVVWDENGEFVKYDDMMVRIVKERWKAYWQGVVMSFAVVMLVFLFAGCHANKQKRCPTPIEYYRCGDYLQQSYLDKTKMLVKDKNGRVKGYYQRSLLDHSKLLFKTKDGKVVGGYQVNRLDSTQNNWVRP